MWIPPSLDIISIVLDSLINLYKGKDNDEQPEIYLSFFMCLIETFLLGNFCANVSAEKLKVRTGRIFITNL